MKTKIVIIIVCGAFAGCRQHPPAAIQAIALQPSISELATAPNFAPMGKNRETKRDDVELSRTLTRESQSPANPSAMVSAKQPDAHAALLSATQAAAIHSGPPLAAAPGKIGDDHPVMAANRTMSGIKLPDASMARDVPSVESRDIGLAVKSLPLDALHGGSSARISVFGISDIGASPNAIASGSPRIELLDRLGVQTTVLSAALVVPAVPPLSDTLPGNTHVDLLGNTGAGSAPDGQKESLSLSPSNAEQLRRRLVEQRESASQRDLAARAAIEHGLFDALLSPVPSAAPNPATRPTVALPWK